MFLSTLKSQVPAIVPTNTIHNTQTFGHSLRFRKNLFFFFKFEYSESINAADYFTDGVLGFWGFGVFWC